MLSPSQRTLRARIGAYALHAQGGTSTKAGTAAFLVRFEKQVDPDSTLLPAERARRAAFARKSYMTSLTLKASRAKHMKTGATNETSAPVTTEGHGNDRPPVS